MEREGDERRKEIKWRGEKKRHFDVFTVLLRYEGRFFFIILLRVSSQGKNLAMATYKMIFRVN